MNGGNSMNRRDFLKRAAQTVAGAAVAVAGVRLGAKAAEAAPVATGALTMSTAFPKTTMDGKDYIYNFVEVSNSDPLITSIGRSLSSADIGKELTVTHGDGFAGSKAIISVPVDSGVTYWDFYRQSGKFGQ